MKFRAAILIITTIAFVSGCSAFSRIEEPDFKVVRAGKGYEIRVYQEVLVAETVVKTSFDRAGNEAFRLLFGYISGKNRTKAKIAMTAPVTTEKKSEKIAMTAPVTMSASEGSYLYRFVMPEKYTMETLPEPLDSRVKLRKIPGRTLAVLRYSGSWSESAFKRELASLRAALKRDGIAVVGEPTWSRYNPPFTPWFLRRNEIWLPVETASP